MDTIKSEVVEYNFKNDFVFKKTIEENPKLAIKLAKMFIRELKDIDDDCDVTFVTKEFKKGVEFKASIFDINFEMITNDDIIKINYEMQNENEPFLKKRIIKYYTDLLSTAFIKTGSYDFKPTYAVWFLDFNLFNTEEFIHRLEMRVDTTNEVWIKNTAVILVEIEKFKNIEYNEVDDKYYKLFLTNELDKLRGDDELMNKVADTIQKVNFRPDYRENLRLLDNEKRLRNAEREAALEEGMEKGLEKGKTEVAKKMKEKGISIEDIMDITGLSKEEIESL